MGDVSFEEFKKWQERNGHCHNDQDWFDNAGLQVFSPVMYPTTKTESKLQDKSMTAPPATNQPVAENADSLISQHEC